MSDAHGPPAAKARAAVRPCGSPWPARESGGPTGVVQNVGVGQRTASSVSESATHPSRGAPTETNGTGVRRTDVQGTSGGGWRSG